MNNTFNDLSAWEKQILSLAGVAQSAALVDKLAQRGDASQTEINACVNALMVVNPDSVADIFPNINHLNLGLRTLQAMFSNDRIRENADLIRYTLSMLVLRNKLQSRPQLQTEIRNTLINIDPLNIISLDADKADNRDDLSAQQHSFEQIARLYQDTISTLSFRIHVQGKEVYLSDENVANQIRSLLLAGIRCAVLWYQLGGRRWRLVLYRNRIKETAGSIRRKLLVSV